MNYKKKYSFGSTRSTKATPLKDAIDLFFKTYKLDKRLVETSIPLIWKNIMGEMISSRTLKIFVKNHELFIRLSSAPLKNELMMNKSKIIDRMNEEVGQEGYIKAIRFL